MSQPLDRYPSRKISFSWEKKPGVSKVTTTTTTKTHGDGDDEDHPNKNHEILSKLPPPPIQESTTNTPRNFAHDFQNIPLPPCAFPPPYYRTSSKKGLSVQDDDDDPFLAAYKECTKNQKIGGGGGGDKRKNRKKFESKLKKGMLSIFTCKGSCSVHHDNLVRISSFPHNIDRD